MDPPSAMSPIPKRARHESGYSSSVYCSPSPYSNMIGTPVTPATPRIHSAYSPMAAPVHSNYTTYSESEDELDDESLDINERIGDPPIADSEWRDYLEDVNEMIDKDINEMIDKDYKDFESFDSLGGHNCEDDAGLDNLDLVPLDDYVIDSTRQASIVESPPPPYFLWDNVPIPHSTFGKAFHCWENAFSNWQATGDARPTRDHLIIEILKSAANIFLMELFTPSELITQSYSGKTKSAGLRPTDSYKLDSVRILAINRILGHLKYCWKSGKTLDQSTPDNEQFCTVDLQDTVKSAIGKASGQDEWEILQQSIFIQKRNQFAVKNRKLPKVPNAENSLQEGLMTSVPNLELNSQFSDAIEWTQGSFISRIKWAEIFLEPEFIKACKLIFVSIFSPEELAVCTLAGKGEKKLNGFKLESVLDIAYRMQDKKKYPYLFEPIPSDPAFKSSCSEELRTTARTIVFVQTRSQEKCKRKRRNRDEEGAMSAFPQSPELTTVQTGFTIPPETQDQLPPPEIQNHPPPPINYILFEIQPPPDYQSMMLNDCNPWPDQIYTTN